MFGCCAHSPLCSPVSLHSCDGPVAASSCPCTDGEHLRMCTSCLVLRARRSQPVGVDVLQPRFGDARSATCCGHPAAAACSLHRCGWLCGGHLTQVPCGVSLQHVSLHLSNVISMLPSFALRSRQSGILQGAGVARAKRLLRRCLRAK